MQSLLSLRNSFSKLLFLVFVVNILFFLLLLFINQESYTVTAFQNLFLAGNSDLFIKKPLTFFTWFWLHTSVFHLVGNLVVLYFFGNQLSPLIGTKKIISLFLLANFISGCIYVIVACFFPTTALLSGLSSSVFAIAFLAITIQKNKQTTSFIFVAIYLILFAFSISAKNWGGTIAHFSGVLVGLAYLLFIEKKSKKTIKF